MKKNKMMRIASYLLVLVLLTTCVISGTFAKYTTSKDVSDSATVAKWGITLKVDGDNVLYDDGQTGNEVTSLKVNSEDLAAPGTYQKLAKVTLTGQPEVAYKITINVDLKLQNWVIVVDDPATGTISNDYCPLVFTVDGVKYYIGSSGVSTVADLEEAIEDAIAKQILGETSFEEDSIDGVYEASYNTGVAVPESVADGVVIDWTWAYDVLTGAPLAGYQTDAKDTILGNAATKATIDFELSVAVNQID